MKLNITYNNQRNNKSFDGIPPSAQCGYTSLAMFLSTWIPEAETDEYVALLVDQIEPKVGKPGIAESILIKKFPELLKSSRFGSYGYVYAETANHILGSHPGLEKRIIWLPSGGTLDNIKSAIDHGSPVFASTMLTKFGHFILIVGYDTSSLIVHDPWGNQYSGIYADGAYARYPNDYIIPAMQKSSPDKKSLRIFYAV